MHGRPVAATLAALIALALPAAASAATFTVNSAGDQPDLPSAGCDVDDVTGGSQCTLRAAIQAANLDAIRDGIAFAINPAGAATVTPATALPAITQPVIVDGSSEDAIADPPLTIDGGGTAGLAVAGAGGTGSGDGTQVFGVRLTGFAGSAFGVTGSYALLQDSVVDGNTGAGVSFGAGGSGAVGGGVDATSGNRISGNGGAGINVAAGAGQVVASFNRIGLDATGLGASANLGGGIVLAAAGQVFDNFVSGNGVAGVRLNACASVFKRNRIGLGTDGATHVGNGGPGVEVTASDCQLGSAQASSADVISANSGPGVLISGDGATVVGELIGTTSAGAATAGNSGPGVRVDGATDATIGDPANVFPNTVAGNTGDGIQLDGSGGAAGGSVSGNDVRSNGGDGVRLLGTADAPIRNTLTTANGGLGIDLGDDGVTANDPTDADTGPNGLQNFPLLATVRREAGKLRVKGSLGVDGSGGLYEIALFANSACDASGNGEGADLLGTIALTTQAGPAGPAPFDALVIADAAAGTPVAATATHASRTSELSACKTVTDPATLVTLTPTSRTVLEGGTADFTVHRGGDTSGSADVSWSTHAGSATAVADYAVAGGTVHFASGETDKPISVAIADDADVEADESFTVTLDGVTNATSTEIGDPSTGTVTIRSQDQDVFVVTNAGDDPDATIDGVCARTGGGCTLRAAIQESNADVVPDRDTIAVADSILDIQLGNATAFPAVDEPLILSGAIAAGRVTIDGNDVAGLTIAAGAAQQTQIFDVDLVDAPLDVIASDVVLQDADVSGASGPGVRFGAGSTGAVGGSAGHGNRIFGNGGDGVLLAGSAGVNVSHNRIGLDGGNGLDGVDSSDAQAQIFDNTVSGNGGAGLRLLACADVVTGNRVGTQADGSGAVPNSGPGVVVAAAGCQVGGAGAGQGNTIAGNAGDGIRVEAADAVVLGNAIRANGAAGVRSTGAAALLRGNSITGNGGLGIDAGPAGVTAGAPHLTAVVRESGKLHVTGTVDAAGAGQYDIEFSADAQCDPSGFGEGATPIALKSVLAASAGVVPIDLLLDADAPAGNVVNATVTTGGQTSEFSACATVTNPGVTPPPGGGTTPPPGGTTPPVDPQSTITSPRGRVKARRLKRIAGTAQDAARVDVAVIRIKDGQCYALTRDGRFKLRTGPGRCTPKAFFRAAGTTTWSFTLKRRFPPGRYRIYSRATAADGTREAPPAGVRVRVRR